LNIPNLPDVKDAVTTLAAVVGIYVALVGLSTWKRQLKGQTDHELARQILVTLYKYREAIKGVRHPAIFPSEEPEPPEHQREKMSREQIRHYGLAHTYQNRWNKVQAQRVELDASLLEAEALWGAELKNKVFQPIFDLSWELYMCVRDYIVLCNPDESDARKDAVEKVSKNRRDILYDSLEKDGDAFARDFATAVGGVEEYLKPKLGRAEPTWRNLLPW
jgi:hypothetical protein